MRLALLVVTSFLCCLNGLSSYHTEKKESDNLRLHISLEIPTGNQKVLSEIVQEVKSLFSQKADTKQGLLSSQTTLIQETDTFNVASGQLSKQSSTSGSSKADLALDEAPAKIDIKPQCMIIDGGDQFALEMDLKTNYRIRNIVAYTSNLQGDIAITASITDDGKEVKCYVSRNVYGGKFQLSCKDHPPWSSKIKLIFEKKFGHAKMFFGFCVLEVNVLTENIAKGKPAKQSGVYESQDPKFAIDGDIRTMQHTGASEAVPWWRVDLLVSSAIRKVAVFNRPGYGGRFHDVNILVSNKDISLLRPQRVFHPGREAVCVENIASEKAIPEGWNTFICNKLPVGRYVSIQITSKCKEGRKDCYEQWLHMMEVEIEGIEWKSDQPVLSMLSNVAVDKIAKQSGRDGEVEIERIVPDNINTTNDHFTRWLIDLESNHLVQQVIIYDQNNERLHNVTIHVGSSKAISSKLSHSVCVANSTSDVPADGEKNVFDCKEPLIGRFVNIQIAKHGNDTVGTNGISSSSIYHRHDAIRVEVMGVPWKYEMQTLYDFQLNKTKAWTAFNDSSLSHNATNSSDQQTVHKTTCSSTDMDAAGQFPWWNVDLKKVYKVNQVIINNRRPPLDALLHDIQIRVGNNDINSEDNSNRIWKKNPLCAQVNGFLPADKNEINCNRELKGQFVSIQITKKCLVEKCFLYDTNVLSLCDVEIIGAE